MLPPNYEKRRNPADPALVCGPGGADPGGPPQPFGAEPGWRRARRGGW